MAPSTHERRQRFEGGRFCCKGYLCDIYGFCDIFGKSFANSLRPRKLRSICASHTKIVKKRLESVTIALRAQRFRLFGLIAFLVLAVEFIGYSA